jgi:hypothetical protein
MLLDTINWQRYLIAECLQRATFAPIEQGKMSYDAIQNATPDILFRQDAALVT